MRLIFGGIASVVVLACNPALAQNDEQGAPAAAQAPTLIVPVAAPAPKAPPKSLGKTKSATPINNPGSWVATTDYPSAALRERREGTTAFRLTVDKAGRVTDCMITSSSGSPDLDQATCSLVMRRAQFTPALDAKGKPTTGTFSTRVRWVIPKGPRAIEPSQRQMSFVIGTDGKASDCVETKNGEVVTSAALRTPCSSGATYKPYTDAAGNPVRKKVIMTQTIELSDAPE